MASSFMARSDSLCSIASSIQSSRRDFAEAVRNVKVSWGGRVSWQRPGVVCMAASKQKQKQQHKKKIKAKRKAGGGRGGRTTTGWSFDALMLVWDEVFDRCCGDGGRAGAIRALGKKGLERFGSGCVLVEETVRTLPRGSASGFSNHARHSSSKDFDEPPAYETLKWTAHYVPRTFVLNPSLAPEAAAADSNEASVVDVTNQVLEDVPLVTREALFSVLRGMDRTRIMGLTGDDISSVAVENGPTEPTEALDAGGEEPYNPRNEEVVLMLVVMVDEQPAVGADVVKARPFTGGEGQELWKLEMRDFHTLPIPV